MPKLMSNLYDDLDKAKAYALSFTNFTYFYGDICFDDYEQVLCEECGKALQVRDYLCPKANCKKPTSILHSWEFGVSPELRDELIANFDVTEGDFRPIRTKRGEIVYYQITPQHTLLPLHEENGWPIQARCPKCGNVRYDRIQQENDLEEPYFYITAEAVASMHDLNVTFERFSMDFPLFVISRRLYDYLIEHHPRTHYFPFYLKEDKPQ